MEGDVFLVVIIEDEGGWADEDLPGEPQWLLFAVDDTETADEESCGKKCDNGEGEDKSAFVLADEKVSEAGDEPCGDEGDGGDVCESFDGLGFVHISYGL